MATQLTQKAWEIRTTRNTTLSILSCHINSLSLKYCLGIMITRTDPADFKIEMTNQQEDKEVVNEESPITDVPILPVEEEIKEPEEQNQEESVKPSPKNDETKEEDRKIKEKTTAKKKMSWFARMMLRFWAWFYKVRDNSHKES